MKYRLPFIAAGLALAAFFFCDCAKKHEPKNGFNIEQLRKSFIVRCEIEGFENLPLNQKNLAYYLSMAVISGDLIAYKQNHLSAAEIKMFLDGVLTHSMGIKPRILAGMREYSALFYINHGFYNRFTRQKFIPLLEFRAFHEATLVAQSNGAKVGHVKFNDSYISLRNNENVIFNPDYQITALPYNKYGFPLDSIKIASIRAGNDILEPGVFSTELAGVVDNLRKAVEFSDTIQAEFLNYLAEAIEMGAPVSNLYDEQPDFTIDVIIDFIPDFFEPKNDSVFTGLVFMKDTPKQKTINYILANLRKSIIETPGDIELEFDKIDQNISAVQLITGSGNAAFCLPDELTYPANSDNSDIHKYIFTNVINARNEIRLKNNSSVAATEEEKLQTGKYFADADLLYRTLSLYFDRNIHLNDSVLKGLKEKERKTVCAIIAELAVLYYASHESLLNAIHPADDEFFNSFIAIWIRNVIVEDALSYYHYDNYGYEARKFVFNYLVNDANKVSLTKINNRVHIVPDSRESIRAALKEKIVELLNFADPADFQVTEGEIKLKNDEFEQGGFLSPEIIAEMTDNIYVVNPKIEQKTTKMGKILDVVISGYPDAISQAIDYRLKSDK